MKRLHLFEFEDLPWFPSSLRDMMTDLLGLNIEIGRLYHPVLPLLADALRTTGERTILDLCSGGGGPLPGLRRRLAKDYGLAVQARLSDFYPNLPAFQRLAARDDGISFVPAPIDATQVPAELPGFRTMFSCLHHFQPPQAAAILRDAWQKRRGIGVFEITERSLSGIAPALFGGSLSAMVLTPLLRPWRLSRLALTYVVPIVPALFIFDGLVSNLRTYTLDEMRAMTQPLQRDDYRWQIGQLRHPILPVKVSYVLGLPQRPK